MPKIGKIGSCTELRNGSFMLRLIKYTIVVNLFICNFTDASSRVCRRLKHGLEDNFIYENVQEIETRQCPPSSVPFSVYNIATNTSLGQQLLLVCWTDDVTRFALQFDCSVQIDDVISVQGVQTRTCFQNDDTIYYRKKHRNEDTFHVLLNIPAINHVPLVFRAFYSQKNNGIYYGHYRVLQYKDNREIHKRQRRDTETTTKISYTQVKMTSASECGKTRSCYRNGGEECSHFGCAYFLSYNTTASVVDIELSARTTGWVAVGFSSDTKMGGDEVIVCRKTQRDEIESGSYKNQFSHQDPILIPGDKVVTLKSFQIKEGYIYCHVTRKLTVRLSEHQDLSNDWYQLYAYGPVSSSGELEKHFTTPLVSSKKISVLRRINVQTSGSGTIFLSLVDYGFLLVWVICVLK